MSGPRAKPFPIDSSRPDVVRVTRLQAARQQLDTAIALYFLSEDSISRHTLLFAAVGILNPMIESKGGADLLLGDRVAPEYRDRWLATLKQSSNFFKHGKKDGDPNDSVPFRPSLDELTLGATVSGYGSIAGRITENMTIFVWWLRRMYPKLYSAPLTESEFEMQRRFPESDKCEYFRYAKWILSPECQGLANTRSFTRSDVELRLLFRLYETSSRQKGSGVES